MKENNSSYTVIHSVKVDKINDINIKTNNEELNGTNPLIQINYNSANNEKDSIGSDPAVVAVIGASAVITGSLISYFMQMRGWKEQRELELKKWKRDRLQEIYSNCIQHLYNGEKDEAQKWLSILLIYQEDEQSFSKLREKMKIHKETDIHDFDTIEGLIKDIIQLAFTDKRLHSPK
ncbi:hypothetical protein [Methanosarcina acetivorans]|nr:hypothetical protein [Methanosarcina acetivorans]